jgi:SAM-dependent methyltransferase
VIDEVYGDDELAALYDLVYGDYTDDLDLYAGFAARGATPALELCAGSGRVALHLARAGQRVVAVDSSPPMLARLRAALDERTAPLVRVIEADVRTLALGERFDLVFIALDSLEQMLTVADALAVLSRAAEHLAEGGVFVTELRTLRSVDWSGAPSPAQVDWTRRDPATGDAVTKWSSMSASSATQTTTTALIFDRAPARGGPVRRRAFDVTLRVFGRFEFELLLQRCGMRIARIYGGADLSPFTHDSDTMVVVAERMGD